MLKANLPNLVNHLLLHFFKPASRVQYLPSMHLFTQSISSFLKGHLSGT